MHLYFITIVPKYLNVATFSIYRPPTIMFLSCSLVTRYEHIQNTDHRKGKVAPVYATKADKGSKGRFM